MIKSISLNIKLVRIEIAAMLSVLFSWSLLFLLGNPYTLYPLMAVGLFTQLKGGCKIFCGSVYREESNFYMALPINNNGIIWGKTLACAFWAMLHIMVITLLATIRYLAYTIFPNLNVYNAIFPKINLGLTPIETGIVVGLRLIEVVIWACATGFFVMAMQRIVSKRGRNGNKAYIVVLSMIAGTVVGIGALVLVTFLEAQGINLWLMEVTVFAALIGVIYWFWAFVKKEFDENFDAM